MPNVSLTLQGLVVMVLVAIFKYAKVDFDEAELTELVSSIVFVVGVVATYCGRLRQKDITFWGKKLNNS